MPRQSAGKLVLNRDHLPAQPHREAWLVRTAARKGARAGRLCDAEHYDAKAYGSLIIILRHSSYVRAQTQGIVP